MKRSRLTDLRRDERGQSTIEFAILIVPLLFIILGMIDFGFAFYRKINESQVASQAARYAAVGFNPSTSQAFIDYMKDQVSGGNAVVSVCFPEGRVKGKPVTVKIQSDYQFTPILNLGNSTIKGKATMRLERPPTTAVIPDTACTLGV